MSSSKRNSKHGNRPDHRSERIPTPKHGNRPDNRSERAPTSKHGNRPDHRLERIPKRDKDGTEEILQVLSHQVEYVDHLEKENKFVKDELLRFERRLSEVVKENQALHDNMRSNIIHQTIAKASMVANENEKEFVDEQQKYWNGKYSSLNTSVVNDDNNEEFRGQALKQWKQEMENIKAIYEAKIEGLEAEIHTTKKDLENALHDNNDLKERLKAMDAFLRTPSSADQSVQLKKEPLALNANIPLIERLTKERDDLMKSVASMRNSVMEAQKIESSLRQEVQRSLAMVEDMLLEKSQTKLENDRFKKDYDLIKQRLESEISSTQKRIAEASFHQRRACQDEMNELSKKVGEMTAILSTYENTIETMSRERVTLTTQLDEARRQLLSANEDLGKMRSEIEHEVRSAVKGYKGAEDELRNTKTKLQQELTRTQQERVRFEQEATDQRRRLSAAQSEALASNELNVTLTQQLNDALHRLQDVRQEREKIEKEFQEEIDMLKNESEDKQNKLEETIQRSGVEYEQRLSDLEGISSKQSNLIQKLKQEGKTMENELRRVTKKYRKENGSLSQDKAIATARLNRLVVANADLEEQVVQHGITHREMQVRLRELDERNRRSAGYATTVLEENDKLVLDKSMLQKEIEFLQSQVMNQDST
ncbi:serologically defined colon cancer antigen 8 homolog [Styela clava]